VIYELLHGLRPWRDWTKLITLTVKDSTRRDSINAKEQPYTKIELLEDHIDDVQFKSGDFVNSAHRTFPISSKLDPTISDFLSRILDIDKKKRLGCGPGGWAEVRAHPWFRDVDWDAFQRKAVDPPIRPDLTRANCSGEADLTSQLVDHKPRSIRADQQKLFPGWKFNTDLHPSNTNTNTAPSNEDANNQSNSSNQSNEYDDNQVNHPYPSDSISPLPDSDQNHHQISDNSHNLHEHESSAVEQSTLSTLSANKFTVTLDETQSLHRSPSLSLSHSQLSAISHPPQSHISHISHATLKSTSESTDPLDTSIVSFASRQTSVSDIETSVEGRNKSQQFHHHSASVQPIQPIQSSHSSHSSSSLSTQSIHVPLPIQMQRGSKISPNSTSQRVSISSDPRYPSHFYEAQQ
jgi:hypothetical protein